MTTTTISSAELAARLHISPRHARRLILANDSRIEGPNTEHLKQCARERIAAKLRDAACTLAGRSINLEFELAAEVAVPEGDQVRRMAGKISRLARELQALAGTLDTPSHTQP
jgi:hypothetical protein